jgi:hypothetical protein
LNATALRLKRSRRISEALQIPRSTRSGKKVTGGNLLATIMNRALAVVEMD